MTTPSPRHWFAPHTAEVELRVEAPSLPELYAEAGRALVELMLGEPPPAVVERTLRVTVHAPDREALLVEWLNELIFRAEIGRCVFNEITVESVTRDALSASLGCATVEVLKTQPKAATLHQVSVREDGGAHTASVVIDV